MRGQADGHTVLIYLGLAGQNPDTTTVIEGLEKLSHQICHMLSEQPSVPVFWWQYISVMNLLSFASCPSFFFWTSDNIGCLPVRI